MKNYFLLAMTLCLVACGAPDKKKVETVPYSQQMVESHGLIDFYCNRNHHDSLCTTGWDYVSGLVANAVLKTWAYYPEKTEYYNAVKAFADFSTNEDGSDIMNSKGTTALAISTTFLRATSSLCFIKKN